MKQVEEEYYKADEKTAQTPTGNHISTQANSQDLYPPSPEQPLSSMSANIPDPVKDALKSLIRSQSVLTSKDKSENVIVIPSGLTDVSLCLLPGDKTPVTPATLVISEDRSPEEAV